MIAEPINNLLKPTIVKRTHISFGTYEKVGRKATLNKTENVFPLKFSFCFRYGSYT